MNWLSFDPRKSLLKLPILWLVIFVMLVSSAIITILIIKNSEVTWGIDYQSINNYLSIFKAPLAITALIIPIVALLAANHRSEQTKLHIFTTEQQNLFANYYKHIEEFSKYTKDHFSDKIIFLNRRRLHDLLFPHARSGNYHIDSKVLNFVEEKIQQQEFNKYNTKNMTAEDRMKIEGTLREIERKLFFDYVITDTKNMSAYSGQGVSGVDNEWYRDIIEDRVEAIKTIFEFDPAARVSDKIFHLANRTTVLREEDLNDS